MDNYHYIIASLPQLLPEFGSQQFSYSDFESMILEQLSKNDRHLVDWLNFGTTDTNLSSHFYHQVKKSDNLFLSNYFTFDLNIRNTQVKFLYKNSNQKADNYSIGETNEDFDEYSRLVQILDNKNIIDREQALDKLRWDKIDEIVSFHYFDINVILAFLAKAKIVQRWLDMDKEKGEKLFEKYVNEVRGTFKGIDFKI